MLIATKIVVLRGRAPTHRTGNFRACDGEVQAAFASAASFTIEAALLLATIFVALTASLAGVVAAASLVFLAALGAVGAVAGGAGSAGGDPRHVAECARNGSDGLDRSPGRHGDLRCYTIGSFRG